MRENQGEIEDEERPGRLMKDTTSENVDQLRNFIDDHSNLRADEIEEQTDLTHGTVQWIISDHLQLRKMTAPDVSNHLTNCQKTERVPICHENLSKFQQGVWQLSDVMTGHESWFYHKQIVQKSSDTLE